MADPIATPPAVAAICWNILGCCAWGCATIGWCAGAGAGAGGAAAGAGRGADLIGTFLHR